MNARYRVPALLVVVALLLSSAAPVRAEGRHFLFSKKFYGLVSIGLSGLCLKEAYDARQDGSDSYTKYKQTASPALARELYDESKRNDTRSALMLGLGVGTLLYGIHLIMSDNGNDLPSPKMDRGLVQVKGVALDVSGDPYRRGMQVKLRKGF